MCLSKVKLWFLWEIGVIGIKSLLMLGWNCALLSRHCANKSKQLQCHPFSFCILNTHPIFLLNLHQTVKHFLSKSFRIYFSLLTCTRIFTCFHHRSNECQFFMHLCGIFNEWKIGDYKVVKLMVVMTCRLILMPLFKVMLMFLNEFRQVWACFHQLLDP